MSETAAPPFVVASHPAKQGFFYRVPLAAQSCGLPGVFLTGCYYKPDRGLWRLARALPGLDARLLARREPALADSRVVSPAGLWPELLPRLGFGFPAANALHDRLAAGWLRRNLAAHPGPVVVHGAIGSARDTFQAAKALGMTRVLEVTSPPGGPAHAAEAARAWGLSPRAGATQGRELAELALADLLLAQNRFSVRLLRELGVPAERILLLPLGADLERFRPRAGERRPGPLRVLFVGHQSAAKGLPVLLEAWRRLAPREAELLLVGPQVDASGPQIHRRYAGCFTDLGRRPHGELPALYADADLFVMPSPFEGGPLVVLEAMASGLPCLVSDAAASVVEQEESGLIVPADDVEALAAGLARLLDDAALRARLGAAARAAAADYGWDSHAARLCRLYRHLGAGLAPEPLIDLGPLPTRAAPSAR